MSHCDVIEISLDLNMNSLVLLTFNKIKSPYADVLGFEGDDA